MPQPTATKEKTNWVVPVAMVLGAAGVTGGLIFLYKKKPAKRTFNIPKPIPSPHDVVLGQAVSITCDIGMAGGASLNGTVVLQVWEGSALTGHGDPLGQVSQPLKISTGETKTVAFSYTSRGAIGRKDVGIVIYDGDTEVGNHEWDDLFYTVNSNLNFSLSRPSALPNPATPGSTVTITCPIMSNSTEVQTVVAKIKIYEGSALAAHGALLSSKSVSSVISPGQIINAIVTDIAIAGGIDRRDIGVEVYVGGQNITSDEWDDVFYVQSGVVSVVSKQSVIYNDNQSSINSGQAISVQIKWKNTGAVSVTPLFRVNIEGTAAFDSPLEGQWVTSPAVGAGQVVTVNALSVPIPTDWQNGKTLHAYVMLQGVDGHWDESSILFTVVKEGGGIPPTSFSLSASYLNGVCYYSFAGFQPNAGIRLTVVETGGYFDTTTNSIGSGSGEFSDNDSPGPYTLRAVDAEGNSATATFTIGATPSISFRTSIWGVPSDFGSYQKWMAFYFDPGINSFVGDQKWYNSYDNILFNNVKSGGYFAVFLKRDSTESHQYTSPVFVAVNGGVYQYDLQLGRVAQSG
jgi:hypothetical protein